ncbi:uncharacterized protein [Leptinotarsa decemlineata]|uniref:uncharacterized protein n=1 Tax=Leptinotarsa decemlineata TaxID=7539 RepID=UPI003D308F3D
MCSRKVRLVDLKVAELKQELEERELDSSGKKSVLQKRLWDNLIESGEDPETYLFEVSGGDWSSIMSKLDGLQQNLVSLEEKLLENSKSLEDKFLENSNSLKEELLEDAEGLKKELCSVASLLEERIGTIETEIDKIREEIKDEIGAEMKKMGKKLGNEIKGEFEAEISNIKKQLASCKTKLLILPTPQKRLLKTQFRN